MTSLLKKPAACRADGNVVDYTYTGDSFEVTTQMKEMFDWDGCVMVRHLFDRDEVSRILKGLEGNPEYLDRAFECADGQGRYSRLLLWNQPGTDITGMVARCEKVVNTVEALLGGEVYHYHTKLMMKEARTGGAHLWHQDYGYWYKNGCLKPDMMTVFIALDRCVRENGCLQVLKGTQRCGRIEHLMQAGQTAADHERVENIADHFEHVYASMEPGDSLFFHCNLLHKSNRNDSDLRRWAFLCAYNRADNDPVYKHHHPNYTPLLKVPNSAIKECENVTDLSGKDFLDPSQDKTIVAKLKEEGFH